MGWEYESGGRGWFWLEEPAAELPDPSPIPRVAYAANSLEDILTEHGIQNAGQVILLAEETNLELAAACVLLDKESGGGHNVWGHDDVATAGTYIKGAAVTKADYLAYRDAVHAGHAGRNGVGPCQLTWSGYQDQADRLGGCWDWRINCTVGFRALAGAIRTLGVREGFRSYNGSGPAASRYADDAMARLAVWREQLHGGASDQGDDMAHVPQDQWTELMQMVTVLFQRVGRLEKSWDGGVTDDQDNEYDAFEYLKRNNVEVRQANLALGSIADQIKSFSVSPGGDFGQLSDVDVARIARSVAELLAAKLAG